MLYADKQQLQRQLEVDLLNLRQKELDHFTTCCLTLSAPAALIAGFAYTGIAEVTVPEDTHWAVEGLYYALTVAAMLFQISATIRSSLVALVGPALALRGKAGSMHRSVEAMEPCFRGAWWMFLAGMMCWLLSTLVHLFNQAQHWAIAVVIGAGILLGALAIYRDIVFVGTRFSLPLDQVEKGAFSKSEVESMFKSTLPRRRSSRGSSEGPPKVRSRLTSVVSSRYLITAAEGSASPQRRTRQTRESPACGPGPSFAHARSHSPPFTADRPTGGTGGALPGAPAEAVETMPSPAPGPEPSSGLDATAAPTVANPSLRACIRSNFESEFREARAQTASEQPKRAVRFEVDSLEGPPRYGQRAKANGKERRRFPRFAEVGQLPFTSGQRGPRRSLDSAREMAVDSRDLINVVCAVRNGSRLRWTVEASTTIAALKEDAETYFQLEISHLVDTNGAAFANADTDVVGSYAGLSGDERVAFFEVIPKKRASTSLPSQLWSQFIGGI